MDVCHGDEKWFYLRDGTACSVFPNFEESNEGVDRAVRMPADPKLYHKSRTPKVMFLTVTARPCIEYGFDGKIGLWPFSVVRKAQRSDVRTESVAGETEIMESVIVKSQVYRHVMLKKDRVFDAMRTKLWWFKGGSGRPEAGSTLYYHQDGAKAHTSKSTSSTGLGMARKQDSQLRW